MFRIDVRAIALVALVAAVPISARAEVCLESKLSGAQVRGELVRFTGQRWDLQTPLGRQSFYIDDFFPCAGGEVSVAAPEPVPDTAPPPASPEIPGAETEELPPAHLPSRRLRIAGSNTVGAELMPTLARALLSAGGARPRVIETERGRVFAAASGDAIAIEAAGSSTGFRALVDGRADLAMSSRPISEAELSAFAALGQRGLDGPEREHVLALDGVVPVVSPSNPLQTISLDELDAVFSGRITRWSGLGLDDRPIRVLARDAQSGTFDSFASLVLGGDKGRLTADAERFESNRALAEAVSADPSAIGFVAAGAVGATAARPLSLRGTCGIVQKSGSFQIKTEDFALARRLFLYTRLAERTGLLAEAVDFALSEAAQPLIEEAGFVSRAVTTVSGGSERARLDVEAPDIASDATAQRTAERLARLMQGSDRVSVTFRFATGSSLLEGKALQDGPLLARFLNREVPGATVMLFGFTDARGPFSANQALSVRRARQAAALLEASGVDPSRIESHGFSELMPVFCNDTPSGRSRNRRVEVWIRPG
ncbi:MAG: substrate-binding domain-containing protein [Paracoccaceae bacterium]